MGNQSLEAINNMKYNNALSSQQQQNSARKDPFTEIKDAAYIDGINGDFPKDPNSEFYWQSYCDGLREWSLNKLNEQQFNWNEI